MALAVKDSEVSVVLSGTQSNVQKDRKRNVKILDEDTYVQVS